MASETVCPGCAGESIYRHRFVDAGSATGPRLLPDLGGLGEHGTFAVFVCADCGLTRFYADTTVRSRLRKSEAWARVR